LPRDEHSRQTPREAQQATFHLKRFIEDNLWELNFDDGRSTAGGDVKSGVNDMLTARSHTSTSPTPQPHPVDAQVVAGRTKWKRIALKQFDCRLGLVRAWAPVSWLVSRPNRPQRPTDGR